ncbi:hypothetical protein ABZ805_12135 [Saccharopolyspora sp. NPDC047091]|uniref:hypothetical protein n=1 Tax=Saccharopolyspora sp. NPDC047091 TaxID=3155924 RepID=UPI0033ED8170
MRSRTAPDRSRRAAPSWRKILGATERDPVFSADRGGYRFHGAAVLDSARRLAAAAHRAQQAGDVRRPPSLACSAAIRAPSRCEANRLRVRFGEHLPKPLLGERPGHHLAAPLRPRRRSGGARPLPRAGVRLVHHS